MSLPFWQRAAAHQRRGARRPAAAGAAGGYYFQSDGSDIADWTTSGMYEESGNGNPSPTLAVDYGDYGYIDAMNGETWAGKTLQFDLYMASGTIPIILFRFACNSTGMGNGLKLDTRTTTDSQVYSSINSWSSDSNTGVSEGSFSVTPDPVADTWYTLRLEIGASTYDVYMDDVLEVSGATWDDEGTYIGLYSPFNTSVTTSWLDNVLIYDT